MTNTTINFPKSAIAKIKGWTGVLNVRVTVLRASAEFYHVRYEENSFMGTIGKVLAGDVGRVSKKNLEFV